MQIITGTIETAQKVVVYGPEGIGKSTFASKFPDPLFIDTEGSTKRLDVRRTPKPTSWTMLKELVREVRNNPSLCKTLVVDTADWAEQLCSAEVCAKEQKTGIEDFGYGKGYVYLAEEFARLLNLLEEVIERGITVVVTAHAAMRKFEQPDEQGAYDRWELKLQKKTAPLLKEWADMVLFANYKTYVVNVDGQGARKGKNKTQDGGRVIYTSHHSCWDAKNRHDLPEELKFDFAQIAHCFPADPPVVPAVVATVAAPVTPPVPKPEPAATVPEPLVTKEPPKEEPPVPERSAIVNPDIPRALSDLMQANGVLETEIQMAVAGKGYYPANTPIKNYDPAFVSGVLVGAWQQVYAMVQDLRTTEEIPF